MPVEPSLRERKKQQTLVALHTAALEMALSQGCDAVTVQKIADATDVSPRTFFNYFLSKDDAIIGISELTSTAMLDDFASDPDPLSSPVQQIVRFVWDLGTSAIVPGSNFSGRHQVLLSNPRLMQHILDRTAHMEAGLEQAIISRLARSKAITLEVDRHNIARVLVSTAIGVLKFTIRKAFETANANNSDANPAEACLGATNYSPILPDWSEAKVAQETYIHILRKLIR